MRQQQNYEYYSVLNNCTLAGNYASEGGGDWWGLLTNCIVQYNTGGNYGGSFLNYCCTTPLPSSGVGNISSEAIFVNTNGWTDLRLQAGSPCIDAGTDLAGIISTDIRGVPRPLDGDGDGVARFDIGAYEFSPYRFGPAQDLGAGGFQLTVCGEPDWPVRIYRSRDLVNWQPVATVPVSLSGQPWVDSSAPNEPRLFYRFVKEP